MKLFSPKIILYPAFWMLWIGLIGAVPAPGKNSISGEIKGLGPASMQLILEEDINRKKERVVAEIAVDEQGRFRWEGELSPNIYRLRVSNERSVRLAIDGDQQVLISGEATGALALKGSEDTKQLSAYEAFRKSSLLKLVQPIRDQIKMLEEKGVAAGDPQLDSLSLLEIVRYEKHKEELIGYVQREMGTSVAIYATSIRWDGGKNIPALTEIAKRFAAAHPNTQIASLVEEKLRILVANSVGGKVIDIRLSNPDGATVALSSIRARYILVDFWGSWCLPCRRESLQLAELYTTYKSQGFEIYAVGLESKKETWLKAIEKDKRSWIHVSSLQLFETPAAFDFSVTSLPSNVLIDGSGTVIARNIHGAALEKALKVLFEK